MNENNNKPSKEDFDNFIQYFYNYITKKDLSFSNEPKVVLSNVEENINKYFDPIIEESRKKEKCLYDALGVFYSKESEISWGQLFNYLGEDNEDISEMLHIMSSPDFIQKIIGEEGNISRKLIEDTIIVNKDFPKQTAKEFLGRYADKIDFYNDSSEQINATAIDIANRLTEDIMKDIQTLQEESVLILSDNNATGKTMKYNLNSKNKKRGGEDFESIKKDTQLMIRYILKNETVKNEPILAKVSYGENKERAYILSKGSKLVCQVKDSTKNSIIQDTVDKINEIEKLLKSSINRKLTKKYFLKLGERARGNAIRDINNAALSFISPLVSKIFEMLKTALKEQNFEYTEKIKKWFQDLTGNLITVLTPHFKNFVKEQVGNLKSYFYKKEDNLTITKYYIQSLFGTSGAKQRKITTQGTLGETIFAAMLNKKLKEKDPKQNFEVKLLGQKFYNFTYDNKKFSGQHPVDIAVIIKGEVIGIQAKQYNSKDIRFDTENFYGKDYNAFDDSFVRYLLPNEKNNSTTFEANSEINNLIKYLRYQSIWLRANNSNSTSATNLLWSHYLQFGRIKEQISKIAINELKNAEEQIIDKDIMNNFFTYNFALVPTSYILKNIKDALIKVYKAATQEAQNKNLFIIKPMEVPSDKQEKFYYKYSQNIANMQISDDYKIVLNNNVKVDYVSAPINFVGVTVDLAKLYENVNKN